MAKKTEQPCCEKFKTMIGGQALIEGIMMRGPEKDAIAVRGPEGIKLEIVDLNRMDIGPLDIKAGCKNLERLPATPQMHRWLAEEYAQARGMDTEECYQLMVAYRSTQPGKIDGKY